MLNSALQIFLSAKLRTQRINSLQNGSPTSAEKNRCPGYDTGEAQIALFINTILRFTLPGIVLYSHVGFKASVFLNIISIVIK